MPFNSAGVQANEIDLSGPVSAVPSGTPAGIIGTAGRGRAFVPVTVSVYSDFVAKFGDTDGKKFGPLAANEWLKNSQSLTYVRVLGVGDGRKRTTSGNNAGMVTNAGFVVGQQQPAANGILADNVYANSNGVPGRLHFLGCYMSESAGSTFFSEAGIQPSSMARPIIRGLIMAASGVVPMVSGAFTIDSSAPTATTVATAAGPKGAPTGSVNLNSGKQEFVLLLNGHIGSTTYPRVYTASFDIDAPNYFGNVLNTDPTKIQNAGHYLYSQYDIHSSVAVVTGTGVIDATLAKVAGVEDSAFITTSSLGRNVGSTTIPNFESYQDRFQTALSPYIISQKFGGTPVNLFRIYALDDGLSSRKLKISISNIAKSQSSTYQFGTFDLLVRDFNDTDDVPVVLEKFLGINLDPGSDRYIAKVIGDYNAYYDFDRSEGSQRLVIAGKFPNMSNYIRVYMNPIVETGGVSATALPVGFRGFGHLVTSGSSILAAPYGSPTNGMLVVPQSGTLVRSVVPPVPMRRNIRVGAPPTDRALSNFYWGVQFEKVGSVIEPNKYKIANASIDSFTKYQPKFQTTWQNAWVIDNQGAADSAGTIFDCDRFNNNMFTLENIQIRTGSNGLADPREWVSASYSRSGSITANDTNKTRAFSVDTDLADSSTRTYAKFSFFLQGGFDGVNIFDSETAALTNTAVKREMDDSAQGQANGPTVRSFKKAIDVFSEKTNADINVLAIPGIRHSVITDYSINMVENQRFDTLYVMDVEERDVINTVVTSSSTQQSSVTNTVNNFLNRSLDTTFAAAYYPDLFIQDPSTLSNVQCPPSVGVLGAIALNDAVGHPWFAPAGFTRGALKSTQETAVKLSRSDLDQLYQANINPITSFPDSNGVVVWGQKTLKATASALDRVNVRRLLIEIRRQVKAVSNLIIFEPNRDTTLARFKNLINPILKNIQTNSGLDQYKIALDSSTTTQADIENNTIRGKIWLKTTHTAEFISIDFVVTNQGATI